VNFLYEPSEYTRLWSTYRRRQSGSVCCSATATVPRKKCPRRRKRGKLTPALHSYRVWLVMMKTAIPFPFFLISLGRLNVSLWNWWLENGVFYFRSCHFLIIMSWKKIRGNPDHFAACNKTSSYFGVIAVFVSVLFSPHPVGPAAGLKLQVGTT